MSDESFLHALDIWKTTPPDDEEPVMDCDECEQPIYEEEYYYEFHGEIFCEDCVRNHRHTAVRKDY